MKRLVHWMLLSVIHDSEDEKNAFGYAGEISIEHSPRVLDLLPAALKVVTQDYHFDGNRKHWDEAVENLKAATRIAMRDA